MTMFGVLQNGALFVVGGRAVRHLGDSETVITDNASATVSLAGLFFDFAYELLDQEVDQSVVLRLMRHLRGPSAFVCKPGL
jgi:hypothetical protein